VESQLKNAFRLARSHGDIEVIFEPFAKAVLYAVAREIGGGAPPAYFAQPAPAGKGHCITVAEGRERLAAIPDVVLLQTTGRKLLEELEPALGILVVYDQGGDYLSREQLDWFRANLLPTLPKAR